MLLYVFILLFFFSSPLTLSLNQDGLFLLHAKDQLSDPDNSLSTWNHADATPCHWRGITCHSLTNSVTAVNLSSFDLTGPFPTVLCRLPSLSSLSLSDNLITFTLPATAVTLCRHLHHLDLSQNALYGPIPDTLSQISSLRYLDLSFNNFSGNPRPTPTT